MFLKVVCELASDVHVIGWHPFYQADPESPDFLSYIEDVRIFKKYCTSFGFYGEYMTTEYSYGANYPSTAGSNLWDLMAISEMKKNAKYTVQLAVKHTASDTYFFFCYTWNSTYALDISLLRRTFIVVPISSAQPQPAFYVMRSFASTLENLQLLMQDSI